jgi:hypothetical protein
MGRQLIADSTLRISARAVIRWQVPRQSSVSLKVYNTAGQMVSGTAATSRAAVLPPESMSARWTDRARVSPERLY